MTEADVDSFFKNKKGTTKRVGVHGVRAIPKRQPFTSVRGNKAPSDKTARSWQKKSNYTVFAHEIKKGSIFTKNQIKQLIIDNVAGMTGANATGISMFAGLVDMGVNKAIQVANDIVRQSRQRGVNSSTFGHPVHVEIGKSHPEGGRFMTETPSEGAQIYYDAKSASGRARYNIISKTDGFKKGTLIRVAYQNSLGVMKKFWKDFKAAKRHVGAMGKGVAKVTTPFTSMYDKGGAVERIIDRMYGEQAMEYMMQGAGESLIKEEGGVLKTYIPKLSWLVYASHKWNVGDTIFVSMCMYKATPDDKSQIVIDFGNETKTIQVRLNRALKKIDRVINNEASADEKASFKRLINRLGGLAVARPNQYVGSLGNISYYVDANAKKDTSLADVKMVVKNLKDRYSGAIPSAPAAAQQEDYEEHNEEMGAE